MKEKPGNLDIRELAILEKLENNGHLTQRDLSKEVGIALGLVNHLLKKMVKKGWINIKNIDAKKIRYLITPEGAREKSSLLYKRVESTIHFYLDAKRVIKEKVEHLKGDGVKSVSIYGINHISEVLFIVLKELGLELTYVVEEEKEGEEWFGYNVIFWSLINSLALLFLSLFCILDLFLSVFFKISSWAIFCLCRL